MSTHDPIVFGIGNPLIDVVIQASDEDIRALSLEKGIMHLVDEARQTEILNYFSEAEPTYRPGGAAPNTLIALAGLGIPSVVCGKIGNDEFGRTYGRQVEEYGIVSRLVHGTGMTGSSVILVTPDGERTMNTNLGMCREFGPEDLDEPLLARARFLYFTGYMWDTDVQKRAIRHALEVARGNGVTVAFDLADPFAVKRYREDFLELIESQVDILFSNRTEAEILVGERAPEELAGLLGARVPTVALKVGKDGAIVGRNGGASITAIPGRPIRAIDSTGAGDMFAAGFLAAWARGGSATDAARAAGRLAEEVIQLTGAQFSVDHIHRLRGELEAWGAGG